MVVSALSFYKPVQVALTDPDCSLDKSNHGKAPRSHPVLDCPNTHAELLAGFLICEHVRCLTPVVKLFRYRTTLPRLGRVRLNVDHTTDGVLWSIKGDVAPLKA